MLLEYPPKIMKPRIDFHCPDHSGIDALLFFLSFFLFFLEGGVGLGECATHSAQMNTVLNVLVRREDLKLLLQQGFPPLSLSILHPS